MILLKEQKDAGILRARNWILRAVETYKLRIHVSDYHKAEYQLKYGNPFYQYDLDPSTIIWKGEEVTNPLKTYRTKKALKKKLKSFKEKYHHDHDIRITETEKFRSHHMDASAFQNCLTVLEHDIEYLENLFTGWISFDKDVHLRLQRLIRYIPELQKVFVMKNEHSFYLISKIEESIKAAEEYEESYVSSESFEAVKNAETQLYKMVADRFSELSKRITFRNSEPAAVPFAAVEKEGIWEIVIDIIVEWLTPEEI